jgi:DNA-binding NtrC family response regulator
MTCSRLFQAPASERKRALVVHEDPTAGYRLADHLAIHGYEAILARQIEDVQPELPHIRPDVIVVDLHPTAKSDALPHLQSVCPLVPIIAMMQPDAFGCRVKTEERTKPFGAGVFVCRSSTRETEPHRFQ